MNREHRSQHSHSHPGPSPEGTPPARSSTALRLPLAVLLCAVLTSVTLPAAHAEEEPEPVTTSASGHKDGDSEQEEDGPDPDSVAGVLDVVVEVVPPATAQEVAADYGLTVVDTLPASADTHLMRAPAGTDIVELAARLAADTRTSFAEPDYRANSPEGAGPTYGWGGGPQPVASDPAAWRSQPELDRIGVPTAHRTTLGRGVVVAVLDTGAQLDHPALVPSLVPGLDLVDGDRTPSDDANGQDDDGDGNVDEGHGHGTHVTGLVLAVAPEARVMPVRVLDTDSRGSSFTVVEGIERAVAAGADVVNLSLSTPEESSLFDRVLEEVSEDVVVVAAAGNTGTTARQYPAASAGVLSVASVDSTDLRSVFSTFGWVDVAAPGEALISTWVGGGYVRWGGTSMAAPIVAGQAALLVGGGEDASGRAARTIRSTAVPLDPTLGAGRVDVAASVAASTKGSRGDRPPLVHSRGGSRSTACPLARCPGLVIGRSCPRGST